MHRARNVGTAGSKVRPPIAELRDVTNLARPNLPASSHADSRLSRMACPETLLVALRTAIAAGNYRVDPEAIAAKLITAITHSSFDQRH